MQMFARRISATSHSTRSILPNTRSALTPAAHFPRCLKCLGIVCRSVNSTKLNALRADFENMHSERRRKFVSLQTPEEIARYRAERKANYPSEENLKRKVRRLTLLVLSCSPSLQQEQLEQQRTANKRSCLDVVANAYGSDSDSSEDGSSRQVVFSAVFLQRCIPVLARNFRDDTEAFV